MKESQKLRKYVSDRSLLNWGMTSTHTWWMLATYGDWSPTSDQLSHGIFAMLFKWVINRASRPVERTRTATLLTPARSWVKLIKASLRNWKALLNLA